MKPIKIKIKDDFTYCEVAFLVDREDFIQDVKEMRKLLGIDELIPNENFERYIKRKNETRISYKNYTPQRVGDLIRQISYTLRKKYRKPFYFDKIITRAIICGIAQGKEVKKEKLDLLYIGSESEELDWDRRDFLSYYDPSIVLIFTPTPHIDKLFKRLKKKFKEEMPEILERYKALTYYEQIEQYINPPKSKVDSINLFNFETRPNIRRDRKWYWKKKTKTYLEIAQGVKNRERHNKEPEDFEDSVKKAVKRYRKILHRDI